MPRELVGFGDLPYSAGDSIFLCADVRRLKGATDWRTAHHIEGGLRQTVDWWRERQNVSA